MVRRSCRWAQETLSSPIHCVYSELMGVGARRRWLLIGICGLAAIIQIVVARQSSLWVDEVFSLALATGHSLDHPAAKANPMLGDFIEGDQPWPVQQFQRYLQHSHPPASPARIIRAVLLADTHPPLYYILLYLWTLVFGTTDMALRSLSIACSLACLPLLISIARRIGGEGTILPSCMLFLFSPLGIYYSTEGRMYSLLWLCVLATISATLLLGERGASFGRCAFWISASAAGLFTHYFFVFPWLATVAYLLITPGKLSRAALFACLSVTAVVILPWYVHLPESMGAWRVTKDWLTRPPGGFNRVTALYERTVQPFSGRGGLWQSNPISGIAALILFGGIALALMWRLRLQAFTKQRTLLWLAFCAACASPLVFDLIWHTYTLAIPRYAMAALPLAYLLAGAGVACLGRGAQLLALVLLVAAWGPSVWQICRTPWRSLPPLRELSRAASEKTDMADLILVHATPSGMLGIARYATGGAALASWVPQLPNRRVPDSLQALAAGRRRVIFVKLYGPGPPAAEERWLRSHAVLLGETTISIGRIAAFGPMNSQTF
jgi:hypothetical protein